MSEPSLLTVRQTECLVWVSVGKTSREIGMILGISHKTVEEHIENACFRLGTSARTHAVALAIGEGIIEAPRTRRAA